MGRGFKNNKIMKKFLLLPFIFVCLSVQWSMAQAPKWVEKAKRAVFSVVIYDKNDKILNTGNGFFVTEDGVALSDYSLFKGAERAVIINSEGKQMPVDAVLGANDMYDVIKAITDGGEYMDYMGMYAPNMITCFARFNGRSVGIIANQPKAMAGCMDINCSDKAARFIRTCDAFGIPLLTLVDVPGFLPGSTQEHGGIIRHGAKVIYAYCEATVPKVTMILRKAYGGAYLAMCCKDLGSDIVYAWPTAEIAVMGAEGAANIIFRKATPEERAELIDEYKREFNNPYKAAERGMVDDVIIPSTSRQMIIAAMEMLDGKVVEAPRKKHGNVPL